MQFSSYPGFRESLRKQLQDEPDRTILLTNLPRAPQRSAPGRAWAYLRRRLGLTRDEVFQPAEQPALEPGPAAVPVDVQVAAARALALELDVMLADYVGDVILRLAVDDDVARTPAARLWDQALVEVIDWLRGRWDYKRETPDGDIVLMARAVLEAADKQRASTKGRA